MIKRRVQLAGPFDDHAAVIIVRADFVALLVTRDHPASGFAVVIQHRHLGFEAFIMPRGIRCDKASADGQMAVDLFTRHHHLDTFHRLRSFIQQSLVAIMPYRGFKRRRLGRGRAFAQIEPTADMAAAARTRPVTEFLCFQHRDLETAVGQFNGRIEPGVSAADDGDIRFVGYGL